MDDRSYLPGVAMMLNNLALLHREMKVLDKAEAEYVEALKIRREIAKDNPIAFMSDVAATLNNLAVLHIDSKKLDKSEAEYLEALQIYRELAEDNIGAYRPDVVMTLVNLAIFHVHIRPNREKSIVYASEAASLLEPMQIKGPYIESYLEAALTVLQHWKTEPKPPKKEEK